MADSYIWWLSTTICLSHHSMRVNWRINLKLLNFSMRKHLRPSHTEGPTGGWPPTTEIVTDHQRPSSTMVPPKMLQSHSCWSATSHPLVVRQVGDQLEWSAKICRRTVGDSRRWSVIGQRSDGDHRISADQLLTSHQYWRPVDAHLTTVPDRWQTS